MEILVARTLWACDGSGHLQSWESRLVQKSHRKMGKKMDNGPRSEMAAKMEKMNPNMRVCPFFAFFQPFQAWAHFPFSVPFSRNNANFSPPVRLNFVIFWRGEVVKVALRDLISRALWEFRFSQYGLSPYLIKHKVPLCWRRLC